MHWLDPDYLPEISGTFERFLLNPHGDADGMISRRRHGGSFPTAHVRRLCAAILPGEKTGDQDFAAYGPVTAP